MATPPHTKPRVGVPWRNASEEAKNQRPKIDPYLDAVRAAGGEPVLLSLDQSPEQLKGLAQTLDAFVLPGSPSDVDPARYGAPKHPETNDPDAARERMDSTLLDEALATHKPVLAICYGTQFLNVYMGGSLFQDLPDEKPSPIRARRAHRKRPRRRACAQRRAGQFRGACRQQLSSPSRPRTRPRSARHRARHRRHDRRRRIHRPRGLDRRRAMAPGANLQQRERRRTFARAVPRANFRIRRTPRTAHRLTPRTIITRAARSQQREPRARKNKRT
jgi:gamma-glutamyl-gamma-aminobutyrate hydrolase PuuD